ncbi:MAG: HPF/RaiA family ribosome-associated protein [Gammaproteobacteria bacterium]|nr:HPF/RaiA family ribosome-associated protein [Gammaproteobacteria bacterium]
MLINVLARNLKQTKQIRNHVIRRLKFAFRKKDDQIQMVSVRLSDVNGPKGGEDKCCQLQITLPHIPNIVIEDTKTDIFSAIDSAVNRASLTINKKLSRLHEKHHAPLSHKALILSEVMQRYPLKRI